jgi:predicted CoA-binding protein
MSTLNDPATIRRLVATPARWAVVGLSTNQARPAFGVARTLQLLGHEIVPVHPRAQEVHGAPAYATLSEVPGHLDVVDLFVNADRAGAVVDEAIAVGAAAVWLQLGVVDDEAATRALEAGLDVVMDRCPAIEAGRLGLLGGSEPLG